MQCDYGCGQEANYTLKNGKNCCCKSPNSCPVNREKNSQKHIGNQVNKGRKFNIPNVECKFCQNNIQINYIKRHEKKCSFNPINFHITSWNIIPCERCGHAHNGEFGNGKFCSRSCSNGHIVSEETKEKISNKLKEVSSWHYLKCNIVEKFNYSCETCGKIFKKSNKSKQRFCSAKCGYSTLGGYREGSGRGKSGWYKGYHCDSSWELAFVIYHLDHKIPFVRNREGFKYEFEGKIHRYYPDFIYEDGTYIEIKGRRQKEDISLQDQAKILNFPFSLNVWIESHMSNMIYYSKLIYGKDFINLYE